MREAGTEGAREQGSKGTCLLTLAGQVLPAAPPEVAAYIREVAGRIEERELALAPALRFRPQMEHVLWAGTYARTCRLPAGVLITSVPIQIPTVLVVHGGAWVLAGRRWHKIEGYRCMAAAADRMQVYLTFRPTEITMIFASQAKTVAEAEAEFTDEAESLLSRRQDGLTGVSA